LAVEALRAWSTQTVSVRINQVRSSWCHLDVIAVASGSYELSSVVVPKVESAADIAFVERLLDGVEADVGRVRPVAIQALIETAEGLGRVDEIAASSSRLHSLILGYADLAASLNRPPAAISMPDAWIPAQHAVLVAARRNGLQAIDGPFLEFEDQKTFVAAATQARDLGFDGKWAVHPTQIATLNEVFAPTSDEIEHARAVIEALERSEGVGDGAAELAGGMVDEAVRRSARAVLKRAGQPGADR
jgi:citrate lyase subunit beta / citryl-CoA lyase